VIFWILLLAGVVAWLSGYHFVGAASFGGVCMWAYLTVRNARSALENEGPQERVKSDAGESYSLCLKSTGANGWDSVELYPSRRQYRRQYCFGGPPTFEEVFEYEVKGRTDVVERLRDCWREDLCGKERGVINGQLVVPDDRQRDAVAWHELFGPIKYFILAHTLAPLERVSYFESEKQRIQKGFDAVAREAAKLGGTWNGTHGFYDASRDASKEVRLALDSLQTNEALRRHGLTNFYELSTYEESLWLLTMESDGKTQSAVEVSLPRPTSS
jgi:hypothetical protein